MNKSIPILLILLVAFSSIVIGISGAKSTCDFDRYVEEYSSGFAFQSYHIRFNEDPYFVARFQGDKFIVIDENTCSLTTDPELSKQVISGFLFVTNKNTQKYLDAYETICDCHKIALYAGTVWNITNLTSPFRRG
jgi:hypothetical protein